MEANRYTFHDPASLPIDDTGVEDGEQHDKYLGGIDWEATVRKAGFQPDDHEVVVTCLVEDWNGHQAGDLVVTDGLCEGYTFVIVSYDDVPGKQ